jgi:hypothetical protein
MIERSLENFRRTRGQMGRLVMVDQFYPLPSKEENSKKLKALAEEYNAIYLDHGFNMSIGCRAGLKYALKKAQVEDGDTWIIYDPDSRPVTYFWDHALASVCSPEYPIVSIVTEAIETELYIKGFEEKTINGYRVAVPGSPCVMSVAAFDYTTIEALGGYQDFGKLYGGLEAVLAPKVLGAGKKVAYLRDFHCIWWPKPLYLVDTVYTAWKQAHALTRTFPGSFEEFIAQEKR